jgi:hypothetical protein
VAGLNLSQVAVHVTADGVAGRPRMVAGVRSADELKILPTWAPLKYPFLAVSIAVTAAKLAGKSPRVRNRSMPACSPARKSASWNAAYWCALAFGIAR